jgi:hypothetical protein
MVPVAAISWALPQFEMQGSFARNYGCYDTVRSFIKKVLIVYLEKMGHGETSL